MDKPSISSILQSKFVSMNLFYSRAIKSHMVMIGSCARSVYPLHLLHCQSLCKPGLQTGGTETRPALFQSSASSMSTAISARLASTEINCVQVPWHVGKWNRYFGYSNIQQSAIMLLLLLVTVAHCEKNNWQDAALLSSLRKHGQSFAEKQTSSIEGQNAWHPNHWRSSWSFLLRLSWVQLGTVSFFSTTPYPRLFVRLLGKCESDPEALMAWSAASPHGRNE